jgi:hypothetical protein
MNEVWVAMNLSSDGGNAVFRGVFLTKKEAVDYILEDFDDDESMVDEGDTVSFGCGYNDNPISQVFKQTLGETTYIEF